MYTVTIAHSSYIITADEFQDNMLFIYTTSEIARRNEESYKSKVNGIYLPMFLIFGKPFLFLTTCSEQDITVKMLYQNRILN